MTSDRPVGQIQHDLLTAMAYRERYTDRSTSDPWVIQMRDANESEIKSLQLEMAEALSGDLEITLEGQPVTGHTVTVPYLSRVLGALQATYRSILTRMDESAGRAGSTLSVAATAPGSFVVAVKTPPAQLEFFDTPVTDRAMNEIVSLLTSSIDGRESEAGPAWAQSTEEPTVRAMIRLAAALASSRGRTRIRWTPVSGHEQLLALTSDNARRLATSLAGDPGREVVIVTGHLEMAQDRPPRVRIRTADDEFIASVKQDELLSTVRELIFSEVQATLMVDMRTSPTSGSPVIETELLDLGEA